MYDLIIIGGGPAGYDAAERAGRAGLKVCLFEKRALGGVCLNEGCIPSKVLLNSAKLCDRARAGARYGVEIPSAVLDQKAVVARRAKVVRTLVLGVGAKMKNAGVTVVKEAASIRGRIPGGFAVTAGEGHYEAAKLLLCTGSEALIPPIPGVREYLGSFVLTNREVLELPEVPEKLVVIGGGVIGLEMAAYYCAAGSRVTVVEMLGHIAGATDGELARMLQKAYAKRGVDFKLSTKCLAIEAGKVVCEGENGQFDIPADKVLLSIGRRANTEGLGLGNIGVALERGAIAVDAQGRTNVEGVYAAGDCIGKVMLAHTACREAEVAVNTILGKEDAMRYDANPSVIYTHPEVASVGLTEEEAKAQGIGYDVRKLSMRYAGRFLAENDGEDGICKILVGRERRNILGVHMLGDASSEAIWGAALLIAQGLCVEDVEKAIFPHPTVSEIIRETIWEFEH